MLDVLLASHLKSAGTHGLPVVDLGVGARPWTTEELQRALGCFVVGVELCEDVVLRAREHERPGLCFIGGGFDVPVRTALVRVMNVLRDGAPESVPAAHRAIGRSVIEGGVVVEGSCGPRGEVGAAHWLVKREGRLVRDSLVFWLDGTRGTAPIAFRDRLPRDLRGDRAHVVLTLLADWMTEFTRLEGPHRLERSAGAVGVTVEVPGVFRWRPQGGVPVRSHSRAANSES